MKIKEKKILYFLPLIIILSVLLFLTLNNKKTVKNDFYDEQILAYENMKTMSDAIKSIKSDMGLPIHKEDKLMTGLIGTDFNEFTTTLGEIKAKRTTTNPEIAAMVVKMFHEVGVEKGDRVSASFSGSFPGMNIAVLSAAKAMDLDLLISTSSGSSTYGGNQIEFTWPEMLDRFYKDGYIPYYSEYVTLGGDDDMLSDKSKEMVDYLINKYEDLGMKVIYTEYYENYNMKKEFLENHNPKAYIAVGGNRTYENSEVDHSQNYGIMKGRKLRIDSLDDDSGLKEYFYANGVPVIHLLNVKRIAADYNLEFDPTRFNNNGEGAIFYKTTYNKIYPMMALFVTVAYFLIYKFKINENNR